MEMIYKLKGVGIAAVLLLACFMIPSSAGAQDVATGSATANILAVLAVSSTHDVTFTDVMQGVPLTADKTVVADAGVFQITGEGNKAISMHLQLPDYLWNSTNTDRMVVSFATTDCDIDTTAAGTPAVHGAGAIADQDPHNIPDTEIGGADNILQCFLGGTVFPTVDQRTGNYSADIVLTVAYTGN